jgi:hypothetical protein
VYAFLQASKRQNSPKILDSILSPQMLILLRSTADKYKIFAEKCTYQENFLPIPDSMDDATSSYEGTDH